MILPDPYPPLNFTLPKDEGLRIKLEIKLEEYKNRENNDSFFATDTAYKINVLEHLLENNEIDSVALENNAKSSTDIPFNWYYFWNAIGVVYKYSNVNYPMAKARGLKNSESST